MRQATAALPSAPSPFAGSEGFDPLEEAVREQVRWFIEQLLEEELEAALARYELLRRFDLLRSEGLTVAVAIAAVGLSRATYDRWRHQGRGGVERLVPRSRRPHRPRRPSWDPALVEATERRRQDFPM